jgi:uncharacterized protein YggE
MNEQQNFLHTLKDNLLIMKDLVNKKIQMNEEFLNNKDGKLEGILKTAQVNIMLNELKKQNDLTDEQIQERIEEISNITKELKEKIN